MKLAMTRTCDLGDGGLIGAHQNARKLHYLRLDEWLPEFCTWRERLSWRGTSTLLKRGLF
jgi:hypothetical protein